MSEVDTEGRMLSTFTDVDVPCHLSLDSQGRLLVADYLNRRILLLTSQLQLQRVLIDTNSQVKLGLPYRSQHDYITTNTRHNFTLHTTAVRMSGGGGLT